MAALQRPARGDEANPEGAPGVVWTFAFGGAPDAAPTKLSVGRGMDQPEAWLRWEDRDGAQSFCYDAALLRVCGWLDVELAQHRFRADSISVDLRPDGLDVHGCVTLTGVRPPAHWAGVGQGTRVVARDAPLAGTWWRDGHSVCFDEARVSISRSVVGLGMRERLVLAWK